MKFLYLHAVFKSSCFLGRESVASTGRIREALMNVSTNLVAFKSVVTLGMCSVAGLN